MCVAAIHILGASHNEYMSSLMIRCLRFFSYFLLRILTLSRAQVNKSPNGTFVSWILIRLKIRFCTRKNDVLRIRCAFESNTKTYRNWINFSKRHKHRSVSPHRRAASFVISGWNQIMMRTIYLFSIFFRISMQRNRLLLWNRKIRKSAWMASHRLSVVPRAIHRRPCFGRKKVRKCSCFRTIRTDTFRWRIKAHCKFVAFRRRMLAILCAPHWVWPVRRRYVHFFRWHPLTIFRRQSYKSDRPIKRCRREVSQCCRVGQSECRRHAFAGTGTACRYKRDNDWLLCRVDHWKSTVSQSDHSPSWNHNGNSSSSSTCNQITIFSFADLQSADTGHYTCTASSESGETSWSASLTVSCLQRMAVLCCSRFFPFLLLLLLLSVHRVLKRKTFHFLHYDYEKLFQFILISICFGSHIHSAPHAQRCWHFRRITLYTAVSIDAWTYCLDIHIHFYSCDFLFGVARWQSELNLWFHFSDYALMQSSVSHKRTIRLALNLNFFLQSRGTHLCVAHKLLNCSRRPQHFPVSHCLSQQSMRGMFPQQIFVPLRTLSEERDILASPVHLFRSIFSSGVVKRTWNVTIVVSVAWKLDASRWSHGALHKTFEIMCSCVDSVMM